jgi:adenylate cyclase
MPGPELHLNSLNALIHHEFIREMPAGAEDLLMVFAAVAAVGLSVFLRSPWLRLLSLGIADLLAAWAALFAYNHASIYIPLICPLAELNVTLFLGLVTDFTLERMEKNRVRRALERYVSRDVVVEMLDNPESYRQSLGGVIRPVTILFSDIRGYSVVSAHSDPHTLVTQLNEYLSAMVACVFQFGGTLDKFIGDAVMAVWGNLRSNGTAHDAVNAVNAALAMQKELAALNEKWRSNNLPALRAGIAIHHGKVVVGNIGSPQRMEFTVIGDAVNVSWRLQELTKEIGCAFIVSDEVRALVAEHFNLRSIGTVNLPGVDTPREIFTVCDSVEREVRDNVSHPAVSAPAYAESVP